MSLMRTFGLLALLAGLPSTLMAQTRFRLADPIAVAQNGGGWSVAPATGAVTLSLPVATVQGELPIPVTFGLNASPAVQVNHLWQSLRVKVYTDDGRWFWANEWVDGDQAAYDRPLYGTLHFGYVTGGASYGNVPEPVSYVLEDGRSWRDADFLPFSNLSAGSFDLAQAFGFSAKAASAVRVDPTGRVGLYTAAPSEFGTWQSVLQAHVPVNYGAVPTQYTVLLDKDRARVYAFLTAFNAWAPVLWVDRFGHSVTFQWTQTTSGLAGGMLAAHCVEAINQRGKGVKLSWATYASSVTAEMDLVRADFVGVAAPSLLVKGYPGLASARPVPLAALPAAAGIIRPDVPGPLLRPTRVQVGEPDVVMMPSWGGATPTKPYAPPPSNPAACPILAWTFTYDANRAALAGATDPLGVQASWAYAAHAFTVPGGVGSGFNESQGGGGLWRAAVDTTCLLGATQMDLLDGATNETYRRTWARTLPDGGAQTQWRVVQRAWFPSKGSSGRSTELNYAPTTSARDYANASLVSSRVLSNLGYTLASQSQTWVGGGLNPTVSLSVGSRTTRQGEPDRATSVTYVDSSNLQVQHQYLFAGAALAYPAAATAYAWETRPNLLDFDRPVTVTDTRCDLLTGATLAPARTVRTAYDASLMLPVQTYRDGGASGKDGQALSYDAEGRLTFMQGTHDEPGFSGIVPAYVSLAFDASTGAPATKTTSYWDPDASSQRTLLTESQGAFDSAGRPQTMTDARGVATALTYDLRGRVKSSATDGSGSVTYAYPDERTVTATRNGRTTTEVRDGFGRLLRRTNPDGSKVEYTYDVYGRQDSQRETTWNGASRTSTQGYDDLDRVVSRISAAGSGVSFVYSVDSAAYAGANDLAVVTQTVMGLNLVTKVYRDIFGQVVKQVAATGETTTAVYDGAGQQTKVSVTPPAGSPVMTVQERTFAYDGLGRLVSKKEPETDTITFGSFNGLNQPGTISEGVVGTQATRTRTVIYDGLGRVRRVSGGSDSQSYVYQGMDLQTAISSHGGESVVQSYQYWPDAAKGKRMKQESLGTVGMWPAFAPVIQYDYDGLGRLGSLTYPSGRVVTYGYDPDGRVVEIKHNDQPLVSNVAFDEWGNRSSLAFASGASSEWTSKDAGTHLDAWTVKYNGWATLSGPRSYSYDGGDRLTQAGEWSLTPDASGRLLAASAAAFGITTSHGHDAYGNNVSHTATGAGVPPTMNNFAFGPQPTNKVPTGNTGWTINGMGEATQIGLETASSQGLALGWDGLGRLSAARATPSGVDQQYRYAASGMRVSVSDAGDVSNNRGYAYTTGGLLLGEYAPVTGVHGGQRAIRVPHRPDQFSAISRELGTFSAGEVVTATVWFKAPPGVHGEMFLGDAGGADPYDNYKSTSIVGNGGWQQITLTHTMTHADGMWIYLYSDQWSVPDYTQVPAHPGTIYDDVAVTGSSRGVVLSTGFEEDSPMSGWGVGVDGVTQQRVGYMDPGLPKREVIYLGSEAVAEIDGSGVYELHNDHLGTPRVVTRGSSIWGIQVYGPYGEYVSGYSAGYQPLTGYTGHVQTDATRLIYMRGRYYSPAWHRFLNSDQGADQNQLNQFAYVGGGPFEGVDPSGMETYHRSVDGSLWVCYELVCVQLTGGATVEVSDRGGVQPGVPTTGFGNWGNEGTLPTSGGGSPTTSSTQQAPQTPQPPKPDKEKYLTCLGNCIEKERFDTSAVLGTIAAQLGLGKMSKVASEMSWLGGRQADPVTSQLSRWTARVEKPLFGTRALRDFGRTAVGGALGAASLGLTVFEGFYDLGAIGRCAAICASDSSSY